MRFYQLRHAGYIGTPGFYKKALSLAVPVMLQLFIQTLVSLIDNFMVSGLGDIKMSGVNIAGQINFVFLVLINTICLSGGVFISQFNGAKDAQNMKHAFRFKMLVLGAISIIYAVFCFFFSEPILALMVRGNRESAAIVAVGKEYMRFSAIMWIPTAFSAAIGSSFREIGRVKPPLVISIIATLVNTFFNWVLIYGAFGVPAFGVKGAAIATVIARACEYILFIVFMHHTKPDFYTPLSRLFFINIKLFKSIFAKSGMILVSEMSWVLTETVVSALYNSRGGADVVSGMAAGFTVANLFFICFSGIHTSVGVIIGGLLGANEFDQARVQSRWLLSGSAVFGFTMGMLGSFSTLLIPLIFGNLSMSAQVICRNLVFVNAIYMLPWAILNAQFAISRAGGDTLMGVVVDMTSNIVLILPSMIILTLFTTFGPVELYAIVKIPSCLAIFVAHFWLKKERWVKNLTSVKQGI